MCVRAGRPFRETLGKCRYNIQSTTVMPRVCIVESQSHPAPGALGRRLPDFGDFAVRTTTCVPDNLDTGEALVLNNIFPEPGRTPEERILQFVAAGGGLVGLQCTVFPRVPALPLV